MNVSSLIQAPCSGVAVTAFTTTEMDGDMMLPAERSVFLRAAGLEPSRVLVHKQVHGDAVAVIDSEDAFARQAALPLPQKEDGWILSLKNTGVAVYTADCVPLLIRDEAGSVVGLAHCGWRGVSARLPLKLARMAAERTSSPLSAYLAPHIHDCCFEFGSEAYGIFQKDNIQGRGGRLYVDLSAEIRAQLAEAGIPRSSVSVSPHCTCCSASPRFHSWRRDKTVRGILTVAFLNK